MYFQNLEPVLDAVPSPNFTIASVSSAASVLDASNAINYTSHTVTIPIIGLSFNYGDVTIDNFEPITFIFKDHLIIDAGHGSDEINLHGTVAPDGDTVASLQDITVKGNDPTASDHLIVNGTSGNDTVNYAPTGFDSATITGAGLVPIMAATMEHVTYSGQGGADALTYTTPVIGGSDQYHLIYTPGRDCRCRLDCRQQSRQRTNLAAV